jgi:DNA primase
MARYTSDARDRVRDATDFVELVSARTELRRAGPRSFEGLCPFHDERTPSFSIEPVEKVYYCFGCQASGDVFTFVQETEGVDFKGALELLADRAGIELEVEAEDPREAERRVRRERLLELLGRTASFYERVLWESTEAAASRAYLAERGLQEEVLRRFRVGYAPSAWDTVLLASRRGGFSERELYDTGLAQRSQERGSLYDRFRARIMFPLADMRGRVLGFGARATHEGQMGGGGGGRGPKYLNTSDNDVYHKGRHLYGGDLARSHAAKAGETLLCEGYTDVIAMHQAGFQNTVGLMGTALTSEQVGELGRLAPTVLLALDADSAGQEAMLKAARLAAQRELDLRVVELPPGADPADLLQREGAEAMRELVSHSVPFVRFRVERTLAAGDDSTPEGRDRMLAELRPVFAGLPQSAMRMELTRLVSGKLGLGEGVAESLLAAQPGARGAAGMERSPAPGELRPSPSTGRSGASLELNVLSRREDTERAFLAQCIAAPAHGQSALHEIDFDSLFTSELLRRAARHLRDGNVAEPLKGVPDEDRELVSLLAELTVEAGRWPPAEGTATPPMLEVQQLQLELAAIERRIHTARAQGTGEVSELARRRGEVKMRFDRAQERAMAHSGAGAAS